MSSEQSHKKRLWRLFLQTSVGICGFVTSRSSGGRSGDTCLALTSAATTNTGVCCFTPRWCSAGMLCPCTNTLCHECTVTHPSSRRIVTHVYLAQMSTLQCKHFSNCKLYPFAIHSQSMIRRRAEKKFYSDTICMGHWGVIDLYWLVIQFLKLPILVQDASMCFLC